MPSSIASGWSFAQAAFYGLGGYTIAILGTHTPISIYWALPLAPPWLHEGFACYAEWLWSEYPLQHPDLRIAMSEGGIGWVAMLIDRLDNIIDRSGYGAGWDERPADVLRRNFWFCTIDDPSTLGARARIGVDHIMVETDYPHADSSWPDTQELLEERFAAR